MRKPITESQAQLLSELSKLTPKERDTFVRQILAATRESPRAMRFEAVAVALDELCFSIDGTTEV